MKKVVRKEGKFKNHKFLKALTAFITFSIIVVGVTGYFMFNDRLIGPAFLTLGIMNLIVLKILKVEINSIYPDMVFGALDNGILVFAAVFGGNIGGVAGAVIGGAIGNTITDSFGGLFEGHAAEKLREEKIESKRTAFSTSIGKMTGCLFGGGASLTLVYVFTIILGVF